MGASWALSNTIPGSLKPDSRDPETETGNLETEKRVHTIHNTLETSSRVFECSSFRVFEFSSFRVFECSSFRVLEIHLRAVAGSGF